MADQIGEEHHGTVEQRDDNRFASAKIVFDVAGHLPDAAGELPICDEDALDLLAPARRYARSNAEQAGGSGFSHRRNSSPPGGVAEKYLSAVSIP
jgi:hypothetical protein